MLLPPFLLAMILPPLPSLTVGNPLCCLPACQRNTSNRQWSYPLSNRQWSNHPLPPQLVIPSVACQPVKENPSNRQWSSPPPHTHSWSSLLLSASLSRKIHLICNDPLLYMQLSQTCLQHQGWIMATCKDFMLNQYSNALVHKLPSPWSSICKI